MDWPKSTQFKNLLDKVGKSAVKTDLTTLAELALEDDKRYYKHTVACISKAVNSARVSRLLGILYAINTICKASKVRRKGKDKFCVRFQPVVTNLVNKLKKGSQSHQIKAARVLSIFRTKHYFPTDLLDKLEQTLSLNDNQSQHNITENFDDNDINVDVVATSHPTPPSPIIHLQHSSISASVDPPDQPTPTPIPGLQPRTAQAQQSAVPQRGAVVQTVEQTTQEHTIPRFGVNAGDVGQDSGLVKQQTQPSNIVDAAFMPGQSGGQDGHASLPWQQAGHSSEGQQLGSREEASPQKQQFPGAGQQVNPAAGLQSAALEGQPLPAPEAQKYTSTAAFQSSYGPQTSMPMSLGAQRNPWEQQQQTQGTQFGAPGQQGQTFGLQPQSGLQEANQSQVVSSQPLQQQQMQVDNQVLAHSNSQSQPYAVQAGMLNQAQPNMQQGQTSVAQPLQLPFQGGVQSEAAKQLAQQLFSHPSQNPKIQPRNAPSPGKGALQGYAPQQMSVDTPAQPRSVAPVQSHVFPTSQQQSNQYSQAQAPAPRQSLGTLPMPPYIQNTILDNPQNRTFPSFKIPMPTNSTSNIPIPTKPLPYQPDIKLPAVNFGAGSQAKYDPLSVLTYSSQTPATARQNIPPWRLDAPQAAPQPGPQVVPPLPNDPMVVPPPPPDTPPGSPKEPPKGRSAEMEGKFEGMTPSPPAGRVGVKRGEDEQNTGGRLDGRLSRQVGQERGGGKAHDKVFGQDLGQNGKGRSKKRVSRWDRDQRGAGAAVGEEHVPKSRQHAREEDEDGRGPVMQANTSRAGTKGSKDEDSSKQKVENMSYHGQKESQTRGGNDNVRSKDTGAAIADDYAEVEVTKQGSRHVQKSSTNDKKSKAYKSLSKHPKDDKRHDSDHKNTGSDDTQGAKDSKDNKNIKDIEAEKLLLLQTSTPPHLLALKAKMLLQSEANPPQSKNPTPPVPDGSKTKDTGYAVADRRLEKRLDMKGKSTWKSSQSEIDTSMLQPSAAQEPQDDSDNHEEGEVVKLSAFQRLSAEAGRLSLPALRRSSSGRREGGVLSSEDRVPRKRQATGEFIKSNIQINRKGDVWGRLGGGLVAGVEEGQISDGVMLEEGEVG